MYRFFQRNQKKLLAIFGAFLMVVFILPGTVGSGRNRRMNPVVGYMGSQKLYAMEMGQARADWELLKRIPYSISPYQQVSWVRLRLGPMAAEIDRTPELFLLLQKEAEREGIRIAPDRVDSLVHGELEGSLNASADEQERRRHAAEAFLLVQSLYDRVADNVKVSEPAIDHYLALVAQELKLNLVEVRADEFKASATAPTSQDIQAQFSKYANVPASQPTTAPASLPFGYQYPNRVKIQYLAVKADQVKDAVRKSKSEYDWEVAAQRYYLSHQSEYPATQVTSPILGPAIPQSQPTTQPFAYVKDKVLETVMQPEVARVTADIRSAISRRMTSDWEQYRAKSSPASAPATRAATNPSTTSPTSTQPTGYASFAYLEQVAADIQKQFGVLPAVVSKADQWLTADDLAKLPGIGLSHTTRDDGRTFANFILQSGEPFFPVPAKADPAAVLSILEPSEPLEDFDGNFYFVRLTGAESAHPPADLAEVRDKVAADVVAGRAYAHAVDEAKKLLAAAQKSGLESAAAAAGRVVKSTGNFSQRSAPTTIPNYPLEADARAALIDQAYKQLLQQATPDHPHPVAVLELPSDRKVVVAELADVTSQLRENQTFAQRLAIARRMQYDQAIELAKDWFRADAVKTRLGYRSADPEEDKRKEEERRKEDSRQASTN